MAVEEWCFSSVLADWLLAICQSNFGDTFIALDDGALCV